MWRIWYSRLGCVCVFQVALVLDSSQRIVTFSSRCSRQHNKHSPVGPNPILEGHPGTICSRPGHLYSFYPFSLDFQERYNELWLIVSSPRPYTATQDKGVIDCNATQHTHGILQEGRKQMYPFSCFDLHSYYPILGRQALTQIRRLVYAALNARLWCRGIIVMWNEALPQEWL